MNVLNRDDNGPTTTGEVMHIHGWLYDLGCRIVGMGPHFRQETLTCAQPRPGERVLDVGCGTGILTRMVANAVGAEGEAVGVDPSPEMIQEAKRCAAKAHNRAEFHLGVIETLPFVDSSFDLVLSSMMLHHLPPALKTAGLQEVYRVLQPGGRLMVVDIDKPTGLLGRLLMFPWGNEPALIDNLAGRITEFIENAGFRNVHHPRPKQRGFIAFWLAYKSE